MKEKKYINLVFVFAVIVLIVVNIISYFQTKSHIDEERLAIHTMIVVKVSESLLTRITEAETSRNAYLITGNEIFLIKYNTSIKQTDSTLSELKKLVSLDREENLITDSLSFFIGNRRDILEESIELQETKKDINAQIELTNKGKASQDRIASIISRLQSVENTNYINQRKELSKSAEKTIAYQIAGTIFSFILLVIGIMVLNKDISSRKKYETALEESRNWFSTTLTSIGDGVIVTNHLGDITFMNPAAETLTKWCMREAKGIYHEHIFNIRHEDTHQKLENPVQAVFKQGKVVSYTKGILLINKSGKIINVHCSASPIFANNNSLLGVVLVFRDMSESRKYEKELIRNKRFVQKITNSTPNILYVYELSGPTLIYSNEITQKILGYSPDEIKKMKGRFLLKLIHKEDQIKLLKSYSKYLNSKDVDVIENVFRMKNKKGEWRWLQSYDVIFTRDKNGVPKQILGTAQDITDKKELETQIIKYREHLEDLVEKRTSQLKLTNEKLQKQIHERVRAERNTNDEQEKFRTLVEYSLVGIYIHHKGDFLYVNPKFEEIFGYESGELEGMSICEIMSDDDKKIFLENIERADKNEELITEYPQKGKRKDGVFIDLNVMNTKLKYNDLDCIIGTIMDVTDTKRAYTELQNQRKYLRSIIDANPNLIFVKDKNGRFTLVNQAVANAYGTDVESLIGKKDSDFNDNQSEVEWFEKDDKEVIEKMIPKFIPEEPVTNKMINKPVWYQTIKIPLSIDNNIQVLGISTDITERKFAEEKIKKSLQEKELLLQEIHHRVKNNLQIIVSLLKLQSRYIHDKRDLEILNKSRARVETMSLIHEKLYRSKDLSNINLRNYIIDLTANLLKAYGISQESIEMHIDIENIQIGIDSAIPCGLIINELVSNSLKHAFRINQKGNINIEFRREVDKIIMNYGDDGTGLLPDVNLLSGETLGSQLITTLVKQLEGTMTIDNSSRGLRYSFILSEIKYRERLHHT